MPFEATARAGRVWAKKAVKKVGNKGQNLIHCSNSISNGGVNQPELSF
jgi:hypothetical protein